MTERVTEANGKEYLTREQVAELIGISARTVDRWVAERKIPFLRLPKRGSRSPVRFHTSRIFQWLDGLEVKPNRRCDESKYYGD